MRHQETNEGLTLNVIAGTHSVFLGIDLDQNKFIDASGQPCLGFTIWRTGPRGEKRPLPNMLSFPSAPKSDPRTSDFAPLQKFRWGDYTTDPNTQYTYEVEARYGPPGNLTTGSKVSVTIKTEDPTQKDSAVYFNRGAASSAAFSRDFPDVTAEDIESDNPKGAKARVWLSRGLEEALIEYIGMAKGKGHALLAAIYEYQKPEFLAALVAARQRGVEVRVVYHAPHEDPLGDETWLENAEAAKEHDLDLLSLARQKTGGIMHNKFVVHLEKDDGEWQPRSVWTGSTNWTHGAVYGQLNVGHVVYDADIAKKYRKYFDLLWQDTDYKVLRGELAKLTPVPTQVPAESGVWPIFSPQSDLGMLDLYAKICEQARCLMVCAPFQLAEKILNVLSKNAGGGLRYLLMDTQKSAGKSEAITVQDNLVSIAATLQSPLYDIQGRLLAARESFQHRGIHIHSKIILADPFGSAPVLVTGSANFSVNSTTNNDSNSLLLHGHSGAIDIYVTEFMRMFDHYQFRAQRAEAEKAAAAAGVAGAVGAAEPLNLKEDGSWSVKYYDQNDTHFRERQMFAGTL